MAGGGAGHFGYVEKIRACVRRWLAYRGFAF